LALKKTAITDDVCLHFAPIKMLYILCFLFIIRTSLHINLTSRAVKTCISHMG